MRSEKDSKWCLRDDGVLFLGFETLNTLPCRPLDMAAILAVVCFGRENLSEGLSLFSKKFEILALRRVARRVTLNLIFCPQITGNVLSPNHLNRRN